MTRIAVHIRRCRSVISPEIRRNTYVHAGYQSVHADCQAERKRARPATSVERTTRFLSNLALPLGRRSESVADAVIDHTAALPELFRKTLTWDQGIEMACHAHIAEAADIKIYFAHPH